MEPMYTVLWAGVGAFIAHFVTQGGDAFIRHSQLRESQRDADLAEILLTVERMGDICKRYWISAATESPKDDLVARSEIMAAQTRLLELIALLYKGSKTKQDCDVELHRLIDAATGGDFADPDRQPDPGRLTLVLIACAKLAHQAKTTRRKLRRRFLA
jgi:hypothetical protein